MGRIEWAFGTRDNDNAFILFHTTQSSVLYLIWMWRDRTKPGQGGGNHKNECKYGNCLCVFVFIYNVRRRVFRFFWWQSFASPCLLFCPSFAHILPVTAKSKITLIVEYRAFLHLKVKQSQNDFFKPTFPPKNKFYFTTMKLDLFLSVFWRKLKTPKRHFEIIWRLALGWI